MSRLTLSPSATRAASRFAADRRRDVVICGTITGQSKLLINQICIEEKRPAVYGGAFRRAYGGSLRVARRIACQQCSVRNADLPRTSRSRRAPTR